MAVITTSSLDTVMDCIRDNQSSSHHPTIVLLDLDQQFSLNTLQHFVGLIQKDTFDVVPVGMYMHECKDP